MQELAELERRIAAALHRIGAGVEALQAATPATDPAAGGDASGEIARLTAALTAERQLTAELRARIAALQSTEPAPTPADGQGADHQARIDQMTRQLDVQGLEMHRMRKTMVQLRENLRGLRRAQAANLADPEQINRAMMAELEAVRVTRLSEVAELDEIITELTPLIREEPLDA